MVQAVLLHLVLVTAHGMVVLVPVQGFIVGMIVPQYAVAMERLVMVQLVPVRDIMGSCVL